MYQLTVKTDTQAGVLVFLNNNGMILNLRDRLVENVQSAEWGSEINVPKDGRDGVDTGP
jgi:hypothetical protein